jgi:hypothetical protein
VGRTDHLSPWRRFCHCHAYFDGYSRRHCDTDQHGRSNRNPNGYANRDSTGYGYSYRYKHTDCYAYRSSSCDINPNAHLYTNRFCSKRLSIQKL